MNVDKFNEEITKVIESHGDAIIVLEEASDYDNVIPQMDIVVASVKAAIDSVYLLCKNKHLTGTGPQPFGEFVLQASLLLFKANNEEGLDTSNITSVEAEAACIALMANLTVAQMRMILAKHEYETDETPFEEVIVKYDSIKDGIIQDAFKTHYIKQLTQGA